MISIGEGSGRSRRNPAGGGDTPCIRESVGGCAEAESPTHRSWPIPVGLSCVPTTLHVEAKTGDFTAEFSSQIFDEVERVSSGRSANEAGKSRIDGTSSKDETETPDLAG